MRDKSRSLLPIIVISIGAALTIFLFSWLNGVMGESIAITANFTTGHVKIMSRAYAEEEDQIPNDLALIGVNEITDQLKKQYPDMDWVQRIRFGGLIDVPDSAGETRDQGPASGWALDLLSDVSGEIERFNLRKSLVTGNIPANQGEALISDDFANKFNLHTGDEFTIFSSTMDGSMAFKNFVVAGTLRFGLTALDRGAVVIDIRDAQSAFNMEDAAGEILGYFDNGLYDEERATLVKNNFNSKYESLNDEYAPVMLRLSDQHGLGEQLEYTDTWGSIMIFIFLMTMSFVLWNAGLLGGLRRYTEFGIRLALGEEKNHIYKTLLYEAVFIGLIGSVIGTIIGLTISLYIQAVGVDLGGMMQQSSSIMMPAVIRPLVTPTALYIGFIPGLFSVVLGTALSGIGIYKRKTARLFKELEV
jgi:putative ABC transport system permease protein